MNAIPNLRAQWPLLAVLLVFPCATRAAAKMRPGIELGVNVSTLIYDDVRAFPLDYRDTSWRPSFTGGLTLEVPLADRFSVQTGLRYVQQGNRVRFDGGTLFPDLQGTFRLAQDYLSVPVLLAWRPLPSDRLSIALGPEFGVLVAANTIAEESSIQLFSPVHSIRHDLESTNITLDAAAGYEFPLRAHTGTLGVRYTHGLSGVAKDGVWASDWKTRGIEVLVGVRR